MKHQKQNQKLLGGMLVGVFGLAIVGLTLLGMEGCGGDDSNPVILRVNEDEVLASEFHLMCANVLAQQGLIFGTPEGEVRLRQVADNVYESLIKIYIVKQAAEKAIEPASDEVIRQELEIFKQKIGGEEAFTQFLAGMELEMEDAIVIIRNKYRFEQFQNSSRKKESRICRKTR